MTREEAIKWLKDHHSIDLNTQDDEAHRMAIEALEQEPFKPMVEIDLYSVIKQKYIEREVLDKIRAEIEQNAYPIVHGVNNHEKGMTLYGVLQIIDKYKAESEVQKDGKA